MSHDIHAAWASAEIARVLKENPSLCFRSPPRPDELSVFASRQGRSGWPIADGIIKVEKSSEAYSVAIEFKRQNEGLHGILTALGQALAYINQGFSGSVIVIPQKYETLEMPGTYLNDVIEANVSSKSIGVFTYEEPDATKSSPFLNRIDCGRRIELDNSIPQALTGATKPETQWAHLREGSSTPSAFFRYLQTAKQIPTENTPEPRPTIPRELGNAVEKLREGMGAIKYLSNSTSDAFHDKVWRRFWFTRVFTNSVAPIWIVPSSGEYVVNDASTGLFQSDGVTGMKFFSGRSDSIKNKLVAALNENSIDEEEAWEKYAENVRARAHSFREDIDSGLEHLGLLSPDGKPSDLGYKFVDACERTGNPHTGTPKRILGAAVLTNGQLGAWLHYVYRLSESKFKIDPRAFTTNRGTEFDSDPYLSWIEDQLANELHVMRKVSLRGGSRRRPFQAELAILRHLNIVGKFRIGLGLEINWPVMQEIITSTF